MLIALVGIAVGLFFVFRLGAPPPEEAKTEPPAQVAKGAPPQTAGQKPANTPAAAPGPGEEPLAELEPNEAFPQALASAEPDVPEEAPSGQLAEPAPGDEQPAEAAQGNPSTGTPKLARARSSLEEEDPGYQIHIPQNPEPGDLEGLVLPTLPFCILAGAHMDLKDAETTRRELLSNFLPAYISPTTVEGPIGQSLYGVTKEGVVYRVLVGHYPSRRAARSTLGLIMEEMPTYQPEIMRFPYTIEFGRFLDMQKANDLSRKLTDEAVFPYTQSHPTDDDRTLLRILAGCYFSRQGALAQKNKLEDKGYPCRIAER